MTLTGGRLTRAGKITEQEYEKERARLRELHDGNSVEATANARFPA
jgi:hypothetical protein